MISTNANVDAKSIHTHKILVADEVVSERSLAMFPEHIQDLHKSGGIYLHDLSYSPYLHHHNCTIVNIEDMLKNGFKIGDTVIKTPKSYHVAIRLVLAIINAVSSSSYGGTTVDDLDIVLEPYAKLSYHKHLAECKKWVDNDKAVIMATERLKEEIYEAHKQFLYELNTMTSSKAECPFVSVGFGLGKHWRSRLIQKAILNAQEGGLGGLTPIFPKLIYKIDEVKDEEVYSLALKCTQKRLTPDYVSLPMLRKTGNGSAPMGCRAFPHYWENVWVGRCNLAVVSVNLPQIWKQTGVASEFYYMLSERIRYAIEALKVKCKPFETLRAGQAPILYMHGAILRLDNPDELVYPHLVGRAGLSLGYIGCAEVDLPTNEILQFMKDEIGKYQSDFPIGLYATPSESMSGKLAELDGHEQGYYTNGFHVPVTENINPMNKIEIESHRQLISNSGRITYVEVPHIREDMQLIYIRECVNYAMDRLGYFGVNVIRDTCNQCDYVGQATAEHRCPSCQTEDIHITRRICGYTGQLGSRPVVKGRLKEINERVKHFIK